MDYPLYEDFSRVCIEDFKEILQFTSFDFYDSDEYRNCPVYKILDGKANPCIFLQECRIHFSKISSENGDFKTAIMDGMKNGEELQGKS